MIMTEETKITNTGEIDTLVFKSAENEGVPGRREGEGVQH